MCLILSQIISCDQKWKDIGRFSDSTNYTLLSLINFREASAMRPVLVKLCDTYITARSQPALCFILSPYFDKPCFGTLFNPQSYCAQVQGLYTGKKNTFYIQGKIIRFSKAVFNSFLVSKIYIKLMIKKYYFLQMRQCVFTVNLRTANKYRPNRVSVDKQRIIDNTCHPLV